MLIFDVNAEDWRVGTQGKDASSSPHRSATKAGEIN